MKKLFILLLGVGLLASCQKKSPDVHEVMKKVTFGVQKIDAHNLKSDNNNIWDCSNTIPDRAWIEVDGIDYFTQLSMVNGQLYSQSIKLSPGSHVINHFVLYKETDGVVGITGSDIVVYGIPAAGSAYAVFVDRAVEFPFEVSSFEKTEVPVQVLCFDAKRYTEFGYDWFNINGSIIREQCFFGDICTENYMDYQGSDYANQSTGLQIDMPAIFQIKGFIKTGDGAWGPLPGGNDGVFTNDTEAAGYGVGAPVCVQYPDKISAVDSLKFELYILVKQGDAFNFVKFHTWMFSDAEMIPAGDDGVVEFELGNCKGGSVDLHINPYVDPLEDPVDEEEVQCTLPERAFLKVENAANGTALTREGLPGYFDVILSDIDSSYCIINGIYPGNSLSRQGSVTFNSTHEVFIRSSLHPELMENHDKNLPWDKANWLINHLADYPGHTWSDIQQALWMLEDPHYKGDAHGGNYDPDPITSIGLQMVADAHLYGSGFVPGPDDLYALVFESVDGNAVYSLFIRYHP